MTRDEHDTLLVQTCLQGDRSAFDELVDRYQRSLFNAAYRITCNRALKLVEKRRPLAALDADAHRTDSNPEVVYGATEAGDFLERALLELGPDHRIAIVLKHILGYSYLEISNLLDLPEKTVKSRLFTARRRLRAVLLEIGFVP